MEADHEALLLIDPQKDFCPGGALAVPDGDAVVPLINLLAARAGHVLLTQDWHPPSHLSFASSHDGRSPFDAIELSYGPQTLWPDHCIQGSAGAAFHEDLTVPQAELIVRKGFRPAIDSYSAFFENDGKTPTGLQGYLRERGLKRLYLAGLAFDYCVLYSALDARRLGFEVLVIEDACRAIDLEGSAAKARSALQTAGAELVQSGSLLG
jgi:nicotinamidase/pyrazinamidase